MLEICRVEWYDKFGQICLRGFVIIERRGRVFVGRCHFTAGG